MSKNSSVDGPMGLRELIVTSLLNSIAFHMSSRVGGSCGTIGSITLASVGCGGSTTTTGMVNRKKDHDTTSFYIVVGPRKLLTNISDGPCSES